MIRHVQKITRRSTGCKITDPSAQRSRAPPTTAEDVLPTDIGIDSDKNITSDKKMRKIMPCRLTINTSYVSPHIKITDDRAKIAANSQRVRAPTPSKEQKTETTTIPTEVKRPTRSTCRCRCSFLSSSPPVGSRARFLSSRLYNTAFVCPS